MPEEIKDVNASATSTGEQAVTEPVGESTIEQSATQEQETRQQSDTAIPEAVNQEGEVDEKGVPWKNRAFEFKRKYQELESNLPSMIQQAVERAIPVQPVTQQTPQYTEEQLIKFKNDSDDPNSRAWAEMELRKLDERKYEERFKKVYEEDKKKSRFEQEQQMALNEVMRKYPLLFNHDGSWNNEHPLTQKMANLYNSRPTFKQDGYGLLGAADMAFADYILQRQPELAKQQKQLKRQVKKLEKATLIEGGGQSQNVPAKTPLAQAKERFGQSGKVDDLKAVAKELLRARGMIQ